MGCNTSKESVQPVGEEAKEDAKDDEIKNSTENGKCESLEADASKEERKEETKEETKEESKEDSKEEENEKDKDEAATRIQAAFRGHHARKSMKEPGNATKQPETTSDAEPTKEQLLEEFRADDKELCNAATKIQASFRGHLSRKEQAIEQAVEQAATSVVKPIGDAVEKAAKKLDEKVNDALNELEGIDLTDPDLHKAATKIQASFRGHKVRQEAPVAPGTGEPAK